MRFLVGKNGRNSEKNLPRVRFVHQETRREWPRRELVIPAVEDKPLTQKWPKMTRDALCSYYAIRNVTPQFPPLSITLHDCGRHGPLRRARGNWEVTLRVV